MSRHIDTAPSHNACLRSTVCFVTAEPSTLEAPKFLEMQKSKPLNSSNYIPPPLALPLSKTRYVPGGDCIDLLEVPRLLVDVHT